jgi:hypothetical protein
MIKRENAATICGRLLCGILLLVMTGPLRAQSNRPVPFTDYPGYVAWMQKHHKAPFLGVPTKKGAGNFANWNGSSTPRGFQNVKVNQDRNPWAKAGIASAVDPSQPKNWVVMSNDFRDNATRIFYHVSSDGGKTWTDDALMGGADIFIGSIPMTYLGNPAISFDNAGNSYFSAFGGNQILDFTNNYLNLDSQVYEVAGFAHGTHSDVSPTFLDAQSCSGTFGAEFVCNGTVSQPLNSTDANSGSPTAGTNYVYYTYFCNLADASCSDGSATIPSFGSVILEAHAAGAGQPYSAPALVSGALGAAQFSNMVIDPSGTAHIFFDDFTNAPVIALWESTLTGGVWTVSKTPVAQFVYNGLANPNWSFTDSGAGAPRCDIHGYTAYCAFSANQVNGGTLSATPSVYLAGVNVQSGDSRVARVNNDPVNDQKDHFFAAPAATPDGEVYVGWYDNRKDPASANVEYFVAKSRDGGRTFPLQTAVSDVPFNPCNGFPGCGYFGDYTQLAAGADGSVHAAWSDTRDGVSMQIWSQTVHF